MNDNPVRNSVASNLIIGSGVGALVVGIPRLLIPKKSNY